MGYDITCIAQLCTAIGGHDGNNIQTDGNNSGTYTSVARGPDGYCNFIEARNLDGLAFGAYWKTDVDADYYYCIGFRDQVGGSRKGNTMTCSGNDDSSVLTWEFYFHY